MEDQVNNYKTTWSDLMEELEMVVDGLGSDNQFDNLNKSLELSLDELKMRFIGGMTLNCTKLLSE